MNIINDNVVSPYSVKRWAQCITISTALLLTACGNSSKNTQNSVNPADDETPTSRVSFKPADGILPLPSDLLFSGTTDGTLEMPDEVAGRAAGGADYTDPAVALGALDGWSTQMPIIVNFDMAAGTTLDASSISGKVRIFVVHKSNGATCNGNPTAIPAGLPCAPTGTELTFGVDFFTQAGEDSLTVLPLTPLTANTTYVVAFISGISDSDGNEVKASATYQLLKDTEEDLSGNASLASLQAVIEIYEGMIAAATGGAVNSDNLIYSMAMSTQSVGDDMGVIKSLLALSPPSITVADQGYTVRTFLTGALGSDPGAAFDAAQYYAGTITLPYYSAIPTGANPMAPIDTPWKALCDNGLLIAAGATGPAGPNDATCNALSGGALRDYGLDSDRHITQYNFIPEARTNDVIDVQMTIPTSGSCSAPYKVAILQHGITSTKEAMLLMTAALSAPPVCMATVAIDHPLHGSRGFDLGGDPGDEINASTVSGTHYMNLSALLVARDNLKQSMADMLGLRRGLESVTGASIDDDNVFVAGLSLGGISSVGFAAVANATVDATFNVENISIHSAGGGIAAFLNESASFGPLVQSAVISAAGGDLADELVAFMASPASACTGFTVGTEAYTTCQYNAFLAQLSANNEAAKLTQIQSTMASFVFAAQTVVDSGDPNNYAASLVASSTPVHLTEVIGDGGSNLADQVIPNQTTAVPFGGTEPLAALLGLAGVDTNTVGGALVRFTKGKHGSLLDPTASTEAPNAAANLAVTTEIQTQVANFFAIPSTVVITDDTYVAPGD
ncbi:hypothetical protein NO559_07210 [Dasania sp. GY-MA-18]|uniref:Bacterial virulence factor lipase N-terminal domain-containing protein n=1 Tax=Dasania phycosphaerae TaxID=2950436 RepID=A0A9J6RLA2_9GAMM|nr:MULTISPECIES: VolA/Pla-1 family phospholipase [Dasania]MCR8922555.1 hypothetical protein [Dasania sp. GY-MA-18]MCZ0864984.1 hypothetical protein [Dasania phycosphaerae]MCZ0868711.1 hypothetical protein [Dasania phycosphaerae]